jgi:hypothetical protein
MAGIIFASSSSSRSLGDIFPPRFLVVKGEYLFALEQVHARHRDALLILAFGNDSVEKGLFLRARQARCHRRYAQPRALREFAGELLAAAFACLRLGAK